MLRIALLLLASVIFRHSNKRANNKSENKIKMKNPTSLNALSLLVITFFVVLFTNCKKSNDDTTTNPPVNNNSNNTPNVLCDGNGASVYYPLRSGNAWTYQSTMWSQTMLTITGTTTFGAHVYYVFDDNNGFMYLNSLYLREDSANHNIYRYDNNSTYTEYLEVPNNPAVNQSWSIENGKTRKVISLNASYHTGSCSYSGLLQIKRDSYTYYYKKGLGLVARIDSMYVVDAAALSAVTLK